MENIKETKNITVKSSIIIVFIVTLILMYGIIFLKSDAHVPLIICSVVCVLYINVFLKISWNDIQNSITKNVLDLVPTFLILGLIGMTVGVWIQSGIVPTLIYYGLNILKPEYFLVASLLISSIISIATGSGWTTVSTIGITLMGIGVGLGIPPEITAGSIISGAYFGDKMSPLSDTTNLAPAIAGTTLFEHIRHMMVTSGISYIITIIIFACISIKYRFQIFDETSIVTLKQGIEQSFYISPILLVVPISVIILAIKKIPAVPSLTFGVFLGAMFSIILQKNSIGNVIDVMQYGFVMESNNAMLNKLLTSGGIQNMMWALSLTLCAITLGSILDRAGVLETIAGAIIKKVESAGSLVLVTIMSCISVNILTGDQYLGIILPGKMYKNTYKEKGLAPQNLSRCLEDAATLTSPLVPWSSCAAIMVGALGIPTLEYLPYCFLNLLTPVISLMIGITGFTMIKSNISEATANNVL